MNEEKMLQEKVLTLDKATVIATALEAANVYQTVKLKFKLTNYQLKKTTDMAANK